MKKEYNKPGMMVTYFNAVDITNMKAVVSSPISVKTKAGDMSVQSFKLNK